MIEQDQILDKPFPNDRIYRAKAIYVGTFLGGPLVAGYLMAENYKVFEETEKVRTTWIYSVIATILIFGGIFLIPETVNIPNQIIPLVYTVIAYSLVKQYQGQKIEAHINAGGLVYSWWRTIGVGLAGLIITLLPIFCIAYYSDTENTIGLNTKSYGIMKHEIDFDTSNISEGEVDKIADGFVNAGFFDEAKTKYVFAKKVGNDYELSISCNNTIIENPDALKWFIQLRADLQALYLNNKIIFNLTVDNLDNVVKRLE